MKPVIDFYPYQRRWLADDSRFKIGMFARQTGKTFTTCGEIVDDCIQAEMEGRRTRWVILSRGERQAKEAVDEAIKPMTRAYYGVYNTLLNGGGATFEEGEFRVSKPGAQADAVYKSLEVTYPSGSRITALPANPDTARGFSANVMLDEFAFHADSREIWKALFPVISKPGLKLRIVSTPNGKGNKFYELMTAEEAKVWSRHEVDIHAAVAEGCPRDVEELKAGINDPDAWQQEYLLKWLDEASSWLTYQLISDCEHDAAGEPGAYQGGPCFVGVDIAARKDLFVIWINELVGDVLWTREIITRRRATFAEQDQLLAEVFARYNVVRCAMDQTGMGEKPVEDAQRAHGESRVEGVLFSTARKLVLATVFKQRFEDRTVRIPMGDTALRADLHAVRKETGATGAPRLLAARDGNGHADRFWAGALAAGAAEGGYQPYDYRPVRPGGNARGAGAARGFRRRGAW